MNRKSMKPHFSVILMVMDIQPASNYPETEIS